MVNPNLNLLLNIYLLETIIYYLGLDLLYRCLPTCLIFGILKQG